MDYLWVMVDEDGTQTLYQLVERGAISDTSRLIKELQLPVVMIDVALPMAKQLEAMPAPRSGSERARLIVVNIHTGNKGEAAGLVAHKNVENVHVI